MGDNYKDLITIGMRKGEWDFGIRATIQDLSYEDMQKLRAMIVTAIGTAEDMWRRRPDIRSGQAVKKETEEDIMKKIRGEVLDNIDRHG